MNQDMALDAKTIKTMSQAFKHPALGEFAEWVALEWLASLANPDAAPSAPLPGARAFDNHDDLVGDIIKNGLREPMIISVGTADSMARLETGSRRAKALLNEGFLFAPAVCSVSEVCGVSTSNGGHCGSSVRLWPALATKSSLGIYAERRLMKPSETIPSCPCFLDGEPKQKQTPAIKKQKRKSPTKKDGANPSSPAQPPASDPAV